MPSGEHPNHSFNRNQPAFIVYQPSVQKTLNSLDEQELVELVTERSNQTLPEVVMNSCL